MSDLKPQLHPDCRSLAFLLGTWRGPGSGDYPTIESFGYNEEVTFGHVGKPFISYSQRTRHAETGAPLHAEAGYLRAVGGHGVEFVVVQPSGIVELHQGTVGDRRVDLTLEGVHTTPTAKSVTDVVRTFWVHGPNESPVLSYDVAMAAVGQELIHHLHADLMRD